MSRQDGVKVHACVWGAAPAEHLLGQGWYRCVLVWSDGTRCVAGTANPAEVRITERLVGPQPTGGTP